MAAIYSLIYRHTVIGFGKASTGESGGVNVGGKQNYDPGLPAKKDVEWLPYKMKESEVDNLWYDSSSGKMHVKYDTGRQVSFDNISEKEAKKVIKARNPSKTLDKHIKPKHYQKHFPTIWV